MRIALSCRSGLRLAEDWNGVLGDEVQKFGRFISAFASGRLASSCCVQWNDVTTRNYVLSESVESRKFLKMWAKIRRYVDFQTSKSCNFCFCRTYSKNFTLPRSMSGALQLEPIFEEYRLIELKDT